MNLSRRSMSQYAVRFTEAILCVCKPAWQALDMRQVLHEHSFHCVLARPEAGFVSVIR